MSFLINSIFLLVGFSNIGSIRSFSNQSPRTSISAVGNIDKYRFQLDASQNIEDGAVVAAEEKERFKSSSWKFNSHDIYTEVHFPIDEKLGDNKNKPAVLLIHGFGCSTTYWRETIKSLLANKYQVHALDLLGQGKSAKPGRADGVEYSISLWADLIDSYVTENMRGTKEGDNNGVVLMGNSLGSLVALSAATGDFADDISNNDKKDDGKLWLKNNVKGICMFNCGVGLNSRGVANVPVWNPLQRTILKSVYSILIVLIFNNRLLLEYILNNIVTRDFLRDALKSLYKCNPSNVDEELVESFYLPAKDDGSVEALSQIYCNDPGKTPFDIHEKYSTFLNQLPINVIWGNSDVVTPLNGDVGQLYSGKVEEIQINNTFNLVTAGHIPFDDNPIDSNNAMIKWLESI